MSLAPIKRPEGLAPKGQESIAQGLPWAMFSWRFGPKTRSKIDLGLEKAIGGRFAWRPTIRKTAENDEDDVTFRLDT
jgi:hypothetical protein